MRKIRHELGWEDEQYEVGEIFAASTGLLNAAETQHTLVFIEGFKKPALERSLNIVAPKLSLLAALGYFGLVLEHTPPIVEDEEDGRAELPEIIGLTVFSNDKGRLLPVSDDQFFINKVGDSLELTKAGDDAVTRVDGENDAFEPNEGPTTPWERMELRTILDACRMLITIP